MDLYLYLFIYLFFCILFTVLLVSVFVFLLFVVYGSISFISFIFSAIHGSPSWNIFPSIWHLLFFSSFPNSIPDYSELVEVLLGFFYYIKYTIKLCLCLYYVFALSISVEYSVSYIYHAMYAYFDRDNVALRGLAK